MRAEVPSVLLIYAGGTTRMIEDPEAGALEDFNFDYLPRHVSGLKGFNYRISSYQFDPPLDSSDMEPTCWAKLVEIISYNHDYSDSFVILHGTDVMVYTASALSFMLKNLNRPVVLTGSQLPVGTLRTDGKESLITAIEIAAAKSPDDIAIIPKVCTFFENHLMRGDRTTKISVEDLNTFRSFDYSPLAQVDIYTKYEPNPIRKSDLIKPLKPHYLFSTNVVILTLFPGIQESTVTSLLYVPELRAVIMKTFGSGNAPQKRWFIRQLEEAADRGIIIVNVTQCAFGAVEMGRYEVGVRLLEAGVISRYDSAPECTITKPMFLLGHRLPNKDVRYKMNSCLIGEVTKS